MNRRIGVTLVEVLVAIFIMGIGMIALLTLFPLGALTMAQAIKDDRAGHAAANASAIFKIWNIGHNPAFYNGPTKAITNAAGGTIQLTVTAHGYTTGMHVRVSGVAGNTNANGDFTITVVDADNFQLNGIGSGPSAYVPGTGSVFSIAQYVAPVAPLDAAPFSLTQITGSTPSYPLYVDPIGVLALGGPPIPVTRLGNIGRVSPTGPRISVTDVTTARRWFSFYDDITFPDNGILANGFDREGRYSWAYLCRMPVANDFSATTTQIDFTVVVYSGRSLQLSASLASASERAIPAAGESVTYIAPNRIQIQWVGTKPNVRKSGWILDDRMPVGNPQGYFYRIVNTTELPGNVVELELQTDFRGPAGGGSVVILDNVVEVFERGAYAPGN